MQDWFGIVVWLLGVFYYQFQGGLECDVVVEVWCYWLVGWVVGVLLVDYYGYVFEVFDYLFLVDYVVMQLVGQQLVGDVQGGVVFYQIDVVDVWYFGVVDVLVDLVDDIVEDVLGVVVYFVFDFFCGLVGVWCQWNGQDVVY